MAELQAQVAAEHGPDARIIAADKVTVGGIRGFFARQHFEVTVEVRATDAAARDTRRGRRAHARLDTQARLGIAALLEDAEVAEARVNGRDGSGVAGSGSSGSGSSGSGSPASGSVSGSATGLGASAGLSTGSGDFAALMDDLTFNTASALPAAVPDSAEPVIPDFSSSSPTVSRARSASSVLVAPRPLGGSGDLVVIIGLHDDALTVAESMAAAVAGPSGAPGDVALAGALAPGYDAAWDRRRAHGARAKGVERRQSLFIAFGITVGAGNGTAGRRAFRDVGTSALDDTEVRDFARLRDLAAHADAVRAIGADQLWVAVDAGRKPEDTARWVHALGEALQIDAVAVVGSEMTASPGTVHELSLPVGWVDGGLPVPLPLTPGASHSQARLV
jgi:hypothetical protein